MKIINQFIDVMEGVEVFPIISLLIFFVFFTLVILRTLYMRKEVVEEMKEIPFDKSENRNNDINT
jgi:tellurite resistance protein TehA-like permease